MKPAPFAYVRPGSLDDVLSELTGGDAKVLAGGQSLAPVLAMRLGRPSTLVDITAVAELGELARGDGASDGPGVLRIGAAVRQRAVERSPLSGAVPLLGRALPFVGHRELRSRGTVCGSLAHADPAAELPAVVACLGASVEVAGPRGRRRVRGDGFASGAMTTAAGPDEVVTAVELPVARPGEGFGFAEIARRHGDFALAGVVTVVRVDRDGSLASAVLTGFGISDRPVTEDVTELVRAELTATDGSDGPSRDGSVAAARIGGTAPSTRAVAAGAPGDDLARRPAVDDLAQRLRPATTELAARVVDTGGDAHGSTGYRRRLFSVLAARELAAAHTRAVVA
ncbi:FAD binding domain-containing protein [Pseudonocardia endophytica]|uniref:Carbon-monoxide dehydrogenase medium subunit n=1 Tax=Pseudonocardia endophytica TaxID=401976 RepID=A0A4R1HP38_PSEEN|nr:FAD binding domain-containing protein [Pseudonocardia endophytica]TCK22971.1 carbon-monoxide dehydrogenase medium subunit [Pseudonocardia endophytica]